CPIDATRRPPALTGAPPKTSPGSPSPSSGGSSRGSWKRSGLPRTGARSCGAGRTLYGPSSPAGASLVSPARNSRGSFSARRGARH
ncbi:MAG: hypothetical protein AVDCRST_MAG05-5221, partial [uncultured Rubrobacteraceae bacterium]